MNEEIIDEKARLLDIIRRAEVAIEYTLADRRELKDERANVEFEQKIKTGLNDIRELIIRWSKQFKDLGWMNGWSVFPPEYINCRQLKHKIRDYSHYPSGSHHEVTCDICKIKWHYDSSG